MPKSHMVYSAPRWSRRGDKWILIDTMGLVRATIEGRPSRASGLMYYHTTVVIKNKKVLILSSLHLESVKRRVEQFLGYKNLTWLPKDLNTVNT